MRPWWFFKQLTFDLIAISLVFQWGCSRHPGAKVGDVAPNFTLPALNGTQVTLSSFRGKNVFIFFWTEGCVFCRTNNIVAVNHIFLEGKRDDLVVLSINIAEPIGDVREFVRQKGLIFPVLLDRDASVTRKKYGVYVVPTLFLIDREGMIRDKAYGYLSKEGLRSFVRPYLEQGD